MMKSDVSEDHSCCILGSLATEPWRPCCWNHYKPQMVKHHSKEWKI